MKKFIGIGVAVLAVAVAVGAYYLFSNLNSLVAAAIEKGGSKVTETSVDVSGVKLSLREGRGSIHGLRVGSPEGFKAGDVFVLDDITIELDVAGVRKDPIVIDEIHIRAPVVYAEVKKDGTSNIEVLRKRVQSYAASNSPAATGVQKKIRIKKFIFEEGRVDVDASALGIDKRSVKLPGIRLDNVGGEQGAPPDQIAKIILTTVTKSAASEVAGSEVHRLIEKQLGGSLPDKAKGLLDKIVH